MGVEIEFNIIQHVGVKQVLIGSFSTPQNLPSHQHPSRIGRRGWPAIDSLWSQSGWTSRCQGEVVDSTRNHNIHKHAVTRASTSNLTLQLMIFYPEIKWPNMIMFGLFGKPLLKTKRSRQATTKVQSRGCSNDFHQTSLGRTPMGRHAAPKGRLATRISCWPLTTTDGWREAFDGYFDIFVGTNHFDSNWQSGWSV